MANIRKITISVMHYHCFQEDEFQIQPTSAHTSNSENINRFNLESILFTLEPEIVFAYDSVEGNVDILLLV